MFRGTGWKGESTLYGNWSWIFQTETTNVVCEPGFPRARHFTRKTNVLFSVDLPSEVHWVSILGVSIPGVSILRSVHRCFDLLSFLATNDLTIPNVHTTCGAN